MSRLGSGAAAIATALAVVAACGGGGGSSATTTSAPPSSEAPSTSAEPTTTTTAIDPALQQLLLQAEDLTGFKKAAEPDPGNPDDPRLCDPAEAPAQKPLDDGPNADGPTLERESNADVEVTSFAARATPDEAQAAMDELLDAKVKQCIEEDLKTVLEQEGATPGASYAVKTTPSRSTVSGVDQVVVLASTITVSGAVSQTLRADFVLLRSGGTVLGVQYFGPAGATSVTERQRIVAVAARKLAATAPGTSTTAGAGGSTSSTSSTSSSGRSSTTRRSSSTTRAGATTSSSRASSTTSTTR